MWKQKWNKVDNEELKNMFINKYKEGIVKRGRDLYRYGLPDICVYQSRFGVKTYRELLILFKLAEKELTKEEKIEISIKELQDITKELGRCPFVKEYNKLRKNGYTLSNLSKHLNMTYNDICRQYLDVDINVNRDVTEEELKGIIEGIIKIKGSVPTGRELRKKKYGFKYDISIFNRKCGVPYDEYIISLGYKSNGGKCLYNKEEMIDNFYLFFKDNYRLPTTDEFNSTNNLPAYSAFKNNVGTIQEACNLLNIDYNTYVKSTGLGTFCVDLNNNLCRSITELDITNFLISNKIDYEKEILYKNIFEDNNTNMRFDFVIKNNKKEKYFVEYFGLYRKNTKSKIIKAYIDKTKRKIKYLYKRGIINNCIFIFPNDDFREKILDVI